MAYHPALAHISALLKAKRREKNFSLRETARECGVSASTLSRIERGVAPALPDAETLDRLAQWLGVSVGFLIQQPDPPKDVEAGNIPELSTPEVVEVHLRADRNLSPETAAALAELFRLAYKQYSQLQHPSDPQDE